MDADFHHRRRRLNNVIFGELGDNSITGGSGNDNIDGGNGFATLSGGGGTNFIVFDRSRDTHVAGGGNDIASSSLNTAAGSPLLAVSWQSVIGNELGSGIFTSGRPAVDLISLDGTTTLAALGGHYFIYSGLGNWTPTELEYNGTPVGTNGAWSVIGAVQTGNGYEVALQLSGTREFQIWSLEWQRQLSFRYRHSFGNERAALETAELTFDQDLNRDGVIRSEVDAGTKRHRWQCDDHPQRVRQQESVISTGTTSVVLSYNNTPLGTNGVWKLIGAVQTGNTYEVALQLSGTSEFQVWTINSTGNYVSDIGIVSGTSVALESAETTFNQDLNGDNVIWSSAADADTKQHRWQRDHHPQQGRQRICDQHWHHERRQLSYNNTPLGTNGVWKPIGAVQTGNTYEVALQLSGTSEFQIWTIDSTGNYVSDTGIVLGTSVAPGSPPKLYRSIKTSTATT